MKTLGDLAAANGARPAASTGAYSKRMLHAQAFAEHIAGPSCISWFTPYMSVCGGMELPMIVIENQADAAKSAFARVEMTRFTEDMISAIQARDALLFPPGTANAPPARSVTFAQKKWLLPHTGVLGEREDNKAVGEKYFYALMDHYAATEIRRFADDLKAAGLNRHDVADGFFMAMNRAQELYARYARTQLPRRKKGEFRADPPVLTLEQLGNGGTIEVIGIDPGTTNLGLCHLKLVAQQLPPLDHGQPNDKSEPIFSLLGLQLVNLNLEPEYRRYPQSFSAMQLTTPTRVFYPDYSSADIRTFFARTDAILATHAAHKETLKRRREERAATKLPAKKVARTEEGPDDKPNLIVLDED